MSQYLKPNKEQLPVTGKPNRQLRRAMAKAAKTGKEIIVVDTQGAKGMHQQNSMEQKKGKH